MHAMNALWATPCHLKLPYYKVISAALVANRPWYLRLGPIKRADIPDPPVAVKQKFGAALYKTVSIPYITYTVRSLVLPPQ